MIPFYCKEDFYWKIIINYIHLLNINKPQRHTHTVQNMSDITSKDIEDNAPRTRQPHKEEFMLQMLS